MKKVIIAIMNGKPESGKTSLQYACRSQYDSVYKILMRSSVDMMYKVYKSLGWNGEKDEEFRKNMHLLKQMYINNCDGPTRDIVKIAVDTLNNDDNGDVAIIFYDVRERSEIDKLVNLIKPLNIIGIYCKTVLVRRKSVEDIEHDNDSDNMSLDEPYDIVFDNNCEMDKLYTLVPKFINTLLEV